MVVGCILKPALQANPTVPSALATIVIGLWHSTSIGVQVGPYQAILTKWLAGVTVLLQLDILRFFGCEKHKLT